MVSDESEPENFQAEGIEKRNFKFKVEGI